VLPATAREHLDTAVRGRALDLAHESRLADPGLTRDDDKLGLAGSRLVETLLEPLLLAASIDERTYARRPLPDHRTP
jgi:hypothetical protein